MMAKQKTILASFSDLTLPDGRRCVDLDRYALAHALIAVGVPGVDEATGIDDSMSRYNAYIEAKAAAKPYNMQAAADEFAGLIQNTPARGDAA